MDSLFTHESDSFVASGIAWIRKEKVLSIAILVAFFWVCLNFYLFLQAPGSLMQPVQLSSGVAIPAASLFFSIAASIVITILFGYAAWISDMRTGRFAWMMISLAYALISLRNAMFGYRYLNTVGLDYTFPGPIGDVIGLTGIFFMYCGLFAFPARPAHRIGGFQRAKLIVDTFLILCAGTAICWYFIFLPIYQLNSVQTQHQGFFSILPHMLYAVLILGLLYVILFVIVRSHQTGSWLAILLLLLFAGMISIFAQVILVTFATIDHLPHTVRLGNFLVILSSTIAAIAGVVLCQEAQRKAGTSTDDVSSQLSIPNIFKKLYGFLKVFIPSLLTLLTSAFIMVYAFMTGQNKEPAFIILWILVALVACRQALSVLENQELLSRERENVEQLTGLLHERQELVQSREEARENELVLREANRQMDEFLNIASHELRTPLTSSKMNIQLTIKRMRSLASSNECSSWAGNRIDSVIGLLNSADKQANRLSRLINDLLDVTRIQSGHLELRAEACDLGDIVRECTDEQIQAHPQREIMVMLDTGEHIAVRVDPDRIGQVLTNYLLNAVKYSPEESRIQITCRKEDDLAIVKVKDEGPGIAPEEQPLIWDRFYRVRQMRAQEDELLKSSEGLGLGLYICKFIIELHHGAVGVESEPGHGATFWFTLPVVSTPPPTSSDSTPPNLPASVAPHLATPPLSG